MLKESAKSVGSDFHVGSRTCEQETAVFSNETKMQAENHPHPPHTQWYLNIHTIIPIIKLAN